jgi:hypothetical protein
LPPSHVLPLCFGQGIRPPQINTPGALWAVRLAAAMSPEGSLAAKSRLSAYVSSTSKPTSWAACVMARCEVVLLSRPRAVASEVPANCFAGASNSMSGRKFRRRFSRVPITPEAEAVFPAPMAERAGVIESSLRPAGGCGLPVRPTRQVAVTMGHYDGAMIKLVKDDWSLCPFSCR